VRSRHAATPYQQAHDELELYFAASDWGLHAGPLDGQGVVAIWDEPRENREHARRLARVGRVFDGVSRPTTKGAACSWHGIPSEHDRLREVSATAERFRLSRHWGFVVALIVLTPRRWPPKVEAEMARGVKGGNLVGLLLTSETLMGRAKTDAPLELLRFAEDRASATNIDDARRRAFFDPLREEAEERYSGALAAYDVLRRERVRAAKDVSEFRRALG
jgi:hypothetical protein